MQKERRTILASRFLVFAAVGENGRTTQILCGESRHTLNYTMLKSIFNYHFHYLNLTFIITALNVKICGYSWMRGDG